jgi:hypothetical protein
MSSKEAILASAKLVKGILDGTMYKDDFYKDDDVTPKKPTEKAMRQQLEIIKNNVNYVKNNDKYLEGVVLNDDENSVINFSKSETIGAFLENGTKNWDNHGGESKTLFSNLQLNIEGTSFIFSFTVDKSSMDYADYVELQANNNGEMNVYSYGNPKDGKRMDSPIGLNYGPSKFNSGTKLTVVVYSANGESASMTYNI